MYGQRNLEVISISIDKISQKEKVLGFLEDKQAAFTNYMYQSEEKHSLIDIIDPDWQGNLPYTMLVAPGGEVVYRHDGIIDPLDLKRAIVDQVGRYFADDEKKKEVDLFEKDNLIAWCIVPFDARERTPEQRAIMLNDLGIYQLAYDYRDSHIPSFKHEIGVLGEHQIKLSAVWLWVEPGEELLNFSNESILQILEETGAETELWLSFPDHFFEGLSDSDKLLKAVEAVKEILQRAEEIGCTIALYNHGAWFGEPENQVRIIEAVGSEKVKMVYNFHHGHHQIDEFAALLDLMLPYLSVININGMRAEGPKIITIGEGERELGMLKAIKASDYTGPIGIIGHTEGEDIKTVLERNLQGLEKLKQSL